MLIAIIGTCLSLAITYHPTNDPLRVLHTAYPGAFLLQRWRTWCTCTISSGRWRDKPCNRHMPPVIWRRHLDLHPAKWFCDVWGTPSPPLNFSFAHLAADPSSMQTPVFANKDRNDARRRVLGRCVRSKVFPLPCCTRQQHCDTILI